MYQQADITNDRNYNIRIQKNHYPTTTYKLTQILTQIDSEYLPKNQTFINTGHYQNTPWNPSWDPQPFYQSSCQTFSIIQFDSASGIISDLTTLATPK